VAGRSIQTQLKSQAASKELRTSSSFHVCISSPSGNDPIPAGDPVKVKTTFGFPFIPFLGFTSIDLVGAATMRAEQKSTYTLGDETGAC
jgi:hypothetical protein